jgi:predicted Zn-ribbon and HTH transcriptional regulator
MMNNESYQRLRELVSKPSLADINHTHRGDIVAMLDELAELRKRLAKLETENNAFRDEIDDARTILANKRNELIIPPDVCSGCLGLGSHVQSGMTCPHCEGTGSA